jgi:hypothetical protein
LETVISFDTIPAVHSLLKLVEHVFAGFLKETLLEGLVHCFFVTKGSFRCLFDCFLVMCTSFTRYLSHLQLHIGEVLQDLDKLVLCDDEKLAFTIHNGGSISSQELIVRQHHLHFTEVSTLSIHIEGHYQTWCILFM